MFNLMSPLGRFLKTTKLNKRRPLRRTLTLERLEAREVPANVLTTVFASASGTLTITGLDDLTSAGVLAGNNDQVATVTGAGAGVFDVAVVGSTTLGPGSLTHFTGVKT